MCDSPPLICYDGFMRDKHLDAGYTLLELMMAVAISAMVVGGGISAYNQFSERQRVVNAGQELVVVLRDVQKRAQSAEKPAACSDTLEGWSIVRTGNNSYDIGADCNGFVAMETKNISSGLEFGNWGSNTVSFEVLTGRVFGAGQLVVQDTSARYVYQMEVTAAGGVGDAGLVEN